METFEKQIEGLTKIGLSSGSSPTQDQVTQFLRDGVKDVIRKTIAAGTHASLLTSFAKVETVTDANGLSSESGFVFSVLKGDGSIMNPAREVPALLKSRVEDTTSLSYASKYNPVYYREAGKIYIKPNPGASGSTLHGEVMHIGFDNDVTYNSVSISNFPESSEYLVVYYAAAMACMNAASNLHNTLPTIPTALGTESLVYDHVSLPTPPEYDEPSLSLDFESVIDALEDDDPEMADKYLNVIDKQLSAFEKEADNAQNEFQAEKLEFDSELQRRMTHADKELGKQLGEFQANIKNYTVDVQKYATEINTQLMQYKWFIQQYSHLMTQYISGIAGIGKPPAREGASPGKIPKKQAATSAYGENEG